MRIPGSDIGVSFAVVVASGRAWIRVLDDADGHTIEVDRKHPLMQSFAHLPGQEVEPILRIAAAFGMAEIGARHSGTANVGAVRARLNELLRGPLAHTTMDEIEGAAE